MFFLLYDIAKCVLSFDPWYIICYEIVSIIWFCLNYFFILVFEEGMYLECIKMTTWCE
jgi:hypothetical protein